MDLRRFPPLHWLYALSVSQREALYQPQEAAETHGTHASAAYSPAIDPTSVASLGSYFPSVCRIDWQSRTGTADHGADTAYTRSCRTSCISPWTADSSRRPFGVSVHRGRHMDLGLQTRRASGGRRLSDRIYQIYGVFVISLVIRGYCASKTPGLTRSSPPFVYIKRNKTSSSFREPVRSKCHTRIRIPVPTAAASRGQPL